MTSVEVSIRMPSTLSSRTLFGFFVFLASLFFPTTVLAQGTPETPTLATLNVSIEGDITYPLPDKLKVNIKLDSPQSLEKLFVNYSGIQVLNKTGSSIAFEISHTNTFKGEPIDAYLKDSWVIDFKEPVMQPFLADFAADNSVVLPQNIAEYVSGYMTDSTYIHGFNIASNVVATRSGDCTEYATLTTALARASGLPSRFMIGTVLIENNGTIEAYGHAWSEVFFNDQWQVVDAALYGANFEKMYYVPASPLKNEGPGFTFSLATAVLNMPHSLVISTAS